MRSSDSLRVYDEQNPVVVESGWPWLSRAGEAVRSVGIDGIIRAKALFGGENMPECNEDCTDVERALRRKTHETIRRVTIDIEERMHLNTVVSSLPPGRRPAPAAR